MGNAASKSRASVCLNSMVRQLAHQGLPFPISSRAVRGWHYSKLVFALWTTKSPSPAYGSQLPDWLYTRASGACPSHPIYVIHCFQDLSEAIGLMPQNHSARLTLPAALTSLSDSNHESLHTVSARSTNAAARHIDVIRRTATYCATAAPVSLLNRLV